MSAYGVTALDLVYLAGAALILGLAVAIFYGKL